MHALGPGLQEAFDELFYGAADCAQRILHFESQLEPLLSPALAWSLTQSPAASMLFPQQVEPWLALEASTQPLPAFLLHCFAFLCPRFQRKATDPLPDLTQALYMQGGFDKLRTLWALQQWQQGLQHHTTLALPQVPLEQLETLYHHSKSRFRAYRLKSPLLRAGWFHLCAQLLQLYSRCPSRLLHPLLVQALKACWNDSHQHQHHWQEMLKAIPESAMGYSEMRRLLHHHQKGLKGQVAMRRVQDQLYSAWHQGQDLDSLLPRVLQKVLKNSHTGSVCLFIHKEGAGFMPLELPHTPYAYRFENGKWRWCSHQDFSQHQPQDQAERIAHQRWQSELTHLHQHEETPLHQHLTGQAVQSRWWSAGESLFIQSLVCRLASSDPLRFQQHPDLDWCEHLSLQQSVFDACERLACPTRAGFQGSTALQHCALQLGNALRHPLDQALAREALSDAFWRIAPESIRAALADFSAVTLECYGVWARRQTGSVPIDGFCQPLLYESSEAGTGRPAVLFWGAVHRTPITPAINLPFVSRMHLHEVTPASDLLRYVAGYTFLNWRQQLLRLQQQYQRSEAEAQRIQQAFERVRQLREAENLAWAALRNHFDPPELLNYGVASYEALKQAYGRLHRPDQIENGNALLCFWAELASGQVYTQVDKALQPLNQLHAQRPDTLLAELYHYWKHLSPEQQHRTQAQTLFNYGKILLYDGSQVEPQLPGQLSLLQLIHTVYRVFKQIHHLRQHHQQPHTFQLHIAWQSHQWRQPQQVHLHRLLKDEKLHLCFAGQSLAQLYDTRHIQPFFNLGKEQLPLRFMEALYKLCTVHFAPRSPHQTPSVAPLVVQHLSLRQGDPPQERQLELRLQLKGCFSAAAQHKISDLSRQHHPVGSHDLRQTLTDLRESVGVSNHAPWFVTAEDLATHGAPQVFFQTNAQTKDTLLVVKLAM